LRQRQLAVVEERLGELERTLADALALLGERKPREVERRARAAARALAEARLDAAAAALQDRLPGLSERRIERRPGRSRPIADLDGGGRVAAVVKRRSGL
jgi:hypothetical protein